MNSIKEAFKAKTTTNSSTKNPKWYNNEKNLFIRECSLSDQVEVRTFASTNPHTPSKVLQGMLEVEQDKSVLRSVIMHANMSRKAVSKFINDSTDERVEWFENDVEMVEHFTQE